MIEQELERFRIWLHSQYLLRANDWEATQAFRKSIDPGYEPEFRYIACKRADAFDWLISNSIDPRVIDQAIDNGWITEWEYHDRQLKCVNLHTQEWRMIPMGVVLHFRLNESLLQTATEAVAIEKVAGPMEPAIAATSEQAEQRAAAELYREYGLVCKKAALLPEGPERSQAYREADALLEQYRNAPGAAKATIVSDRQSLIHSLTAEYFMASRELGPRERKRWSKWIDAPEPKPKLPRTTNPRLDELAKEWDELNESETATAKQDANGYPAGEDCFRRDAKIHELVEAGWINSEIAAELERLSHAENWLAIAEDTIRKRLTEYCGFTQKPKPKRGGRPKKTR